MKLSRRGLFGVFAGAGAAAVAPKMAMAAPATEVTLSREALATHDLLCTTAVGGGFSLAPLKASGSRIDCA